MGKKQLFLNQNARDITMPIETELICLQSIVLQSSKSM